MFDLTRAVPVPGYQLSSGLDLEADDWQGIVDNYVNANPAAETQRKIAQEIDDLCAAQSESDLAQFLIRGVGVSYDPRPEATWVCWR
ncbi:hypothetical protein [Mycolicibacterium pulveris]|uniref:hypothetical protein n=1 Tax=Mycolicibacterium pulveris TaxID=36813 RepID=UPI003CE7E59E